MDVSSLLPLLQPHSVRVHTREQVDQRVYMIQAAGRHADWRLTILVRQTVSRALAEETLPQIICLPVCTSVCTYGSYFLSIF